MLLEYFSQSRFHKHTVSSSNTGKKNKKKKKQAGQFGNSPDFCVEPERKESEEGRLEKGGQSPQKRNETNGFEMLFDAMRFFSAN